MAKVNLASVIKNDIDWLEARISNLRTFSRGERKESNQAFLREAHFAVEKAQIIERDAVRQARLVGRSWADIGGDLGMTRQAAHEKFRDLDVI